MCVHAHAAHLAAQCMGGSPTNSLPRPSAAPSCIQEFSGLEGDVAALKGAADKRKAAARRKVKALQDSSSAKLSDVQAKVEKFRQHSSKLPGLAKVVQAFM